jgi:hypothetical protein
VCACARLGPCSCVSKVAALLPAPLADGCVFMCANTECLACPVCLVLYVYMVPPSWRFTRGIGRGCDAPGTLCVLACCMQNDTTCAAAKQELCFCVYSHPPPLSWELS